MGRPRTVVAVVALVRVDVYASQWHYLDHLEPIWHALPEEVRGAVLVTAPALRRHSLAVAAEANASRLGSERISRVLVAGGPDMETASRQRWGCALVEHGAGQGYLDAAGHPSYPGGVHRESVGLFICTNRSVARRNDTVAPGRSVVTGSPRLDVLSAIRSGRDSSREPARPVLALAWHFATRASRESFWAFPEYQASLVDIVTEWPGRVIGTAHPKAWRHVQTAYRSAGIEPVPLWADVVARADVVAFDNSSVGFEAAALGIPVVLMNSLRWRKDVEHGFRFWAYSGIGPQVDPRGDSRAIARDVVLAASEAFRFPALWDAPREVMGREVYPHRGEAIERAVDAICRWVGFDREADVAT